jgi:argininosuccinate synthase
LTTEGSGLAKERVVLAFSGGLSSTAAIPWISERYGVEVVTVTLDVGQGRELDGIREQAIAAGAIRAHVLDRAAALVADAAWPLVQAGLDPVPTAQTLTAPLIAQALVEVARLERASGLAHGGRGGAARQLDGLVRSLESGIRLLPAAAPDGSGLAAVVRYLEERGIPSPGRSDRLVTTTTIWGRTVHGRALEDSWVDVPDDVSTAVRPAAEGPDHPASIEIRFECGIPVAVNGVTMPLVELVESVATIAGAHGVGLSELWVDHGEDGQRREVRESPAATVLAQAYRALESLTLDARHQAFRPQLAAQYSALLTGGGWFSPFRRSLDAYRLDAQARINGTVRLSLFKGSSRVVGQRTTQYDRPTVAVAG